VDNKSRSKSTKGMKYLDLTCDTPAQNLACDEALLAWCEGEHKDGVLRVWESPLYCVVAGYSNKLTAEVNEKTCAADGVPVLRRCTGGGAVLQGPGCLNYALIFDHEAIEGLGDLARTYGFVLERHRRLFADLTGAAVIIEGTSDLTADGRKFSGNSQYRKRRWTLIHGTFLLRFDLARIARYLPMPSKAPDYRRHRSHTDFLVNLGIDRRILSRELRTIWKAEQEASAPPPRMIDELVRQRYARPEWNRKF
jgi:lipoate-protein ligase A